MSMASEFKEFALRGNMVDLAVGIVVGGAFGGVVKSLVDDVLMPPLGLLISGVDFKNIAITLREATAATATAPATAAVVLNIGAFISALINFGILAFAVFMVIKAMNHMADKTIARPVASTKPV
jgi:large conductance mechanosensitive channel